MAARLLLLLAALLPRAPGAAAAAVAAGLRCPPQPACQELYNVTDDYFFLVGGVKLLVSYTGLDFKLKCPENVSLESENLPRFASPVTFERVKLEACALPASGLARVLLALGVRARDSLQLLRSPPPPAAPALAAHHFAGLAVRALQVEVSGSGAAAAEDWLAGLPHLLDLRVAGVALPAGALLALPAGLKSLALGDPLLATLPPGALRRLPALRRLALRAPLAAVPELAAAAALAELVLDAPVADLPVPAVLQNVTLRNSRLSSVSGECGALERLTLVNATRLPAAGWLARCPRLRELRLEAPAAALAPGALRGAAALRVLAVRRARAPELPPALLADAPALRRLDLSSNALEDLPSGLLGAPLQLEELDLSDNRLRAAALAALAPLRALRTLALARNPLGDLCGASASYLANDLSALRELRALRSLRLAGARLTRVCRDWRALPALEDLDLSYNRITELSFQDVQWACALDLRGNPLAAVRYERADYERAVAAAGPAVSLRLDGGARVACDCQAYWFARALQERPQHAPPALAALRCRAHTDEDPDAAPPLRSVPLDTLLCDVPQEECAAGCTCAANGGGSVLRCERAGLRRPPRAPVPLPPPRELRLAGNHISALRREDLPPELELVDLRDNRIAELDAAAWGALLAPPRRVLLRGNPLRCDCAAREPLYLLQARAAQLDAENVTCADGRALLALRPGELCAAPAAALARALPALAAGALLLVLAMTALLCLARRSTRLWIKRFLLRRNLCLRLLLRGDGEPDDDDDDDCEYDAFVSFSHHDERFVLDHLVPRLEGRVGGARARRLCLHYRDWVPGEWIPTQIAESVRKSRRTLVVLSGAFLRSTWARAEFREAHARALRDRRPRLALLLLEPPPPHLLDPELAAFLENNTYLRWGDPWFWDKLLHAVPAGKRRADTPAPPAPPAPPTPPVSPAPAVCA